MVDPYAYAGEDNNVQLIDLVTTLSVDTVMHRLRNVRQNVAFVPLPPCGEEHSPPVWKVFDERPFRLFVFVDGERYTIHGRSKSLFLNMQMVPLS